MSCTDAVIFTSLHFTSLHIHSLHFTFSEWFLPQLHLALFITFLNLFLKLLDLQERVPKASAGNWYILHVSVFILLQSSNNMITTFPFRRVIIDSCHMKLPRNYLPIEINIPPPEAFIQGNTWNWQHQKQLLRVKEGARPHGCVGQWKLMDFGDVNYPTGRILMIVFPKHDIL
jgi:hypothetical protein